MSSLRAYLGLLGAICIHIVIGTVYMSGNIEAYLVSYLRVHGDDVSLEDAMIILPIQIVSSTLIFPLGAKLAATFGSRLVAAVGNLIVVLATFCGSFCTNLSSFCIVYALGFGIGDGLSYMGPLMMAWSLFPYHKGRVTGLILMCFALGSSLFNLISTAIINPNNESAYLVIQNGKAQDHYYGKDVADRFPMMMRWLSLVYLCISALGVLLLAPIQSLSHEAELRVPNALPDLKTAVLHPVFRLLFLMCLCSSSYGLYVAAAYKNFGSEDISSDTFLATIGAACAFSNGLFRLIWGQVMDLSSFKLVYGIILLIQIVLSASIYFVVWNKWLFLIWVSGSMACEGGHFSLLATVSVKLFGKEHGGKVSGLLFYNFGLSSMLGFLLELFIVKHTGYLAMFLTFSATSVVSLVLLLWKFKEKTPWSFDGASVVGFKPLKTKH